MIDKKRILVIAAHPDDEVLGCGGSIAKFKTIGHEVFLHVLSEGESSRFSPQIDNRLKALLKSKDYLNIDHLKISHFSDSKFDTSPLLEIIQSIEEIIHAFNPHIIFTHNNNDLNIDHKITHLATMTAARPLPNQSLEKILSYEVNSSTEYALSNNPFLPNYFEELSILHVNSKLNALSCYEDELRPYPHPRSLEAIKAQLMVRGTNAGLCYAEAFKVEKIISRNNE